MSPTPMTVGAGLLALIIAGTGLLSTPSDAASDKASDAPVRCEIVTEAAGSMLRLTGVLHSDRDLAGDYRFAVKSAGRAGGTDISQGGRFTASAFGTTALGMVMLSADAIYDADLEIRAGGAPIVCAERVGGVL